MGSGGKDPPNVEALPLLQSLEHECHERRAAIRELTEQLQGLRRLERVALSGADSIRLAPLSQLRREMLQPFLEMPSTVADEAEGDPAEKGAASLLRDVRHWHSELRRLEAEGGGESSSPSPSSALSEVRAELSALRRLLAEEEELRAVAEERLQKLPARTPLVALPLPETPPGTCSASVAAGIRLATGTARLLPASQKTFS